MVGLCFACDLSATELGFEWEVRGFFCVMQWKKEMSSQAGPPGFDDATPIDAKPKTKSVKRNERKKEKRLQVCLLFSYCLTSVSRSPSLFFSSFNLLLFDIHCYLFLNGIYRLLCFICEEKLE